MSKFRSDINGLRAWAVASVILYHFGIWGFSGGFVGVDVFFVISGFLMTGIIFEKTINNNFSLFDFYISRCIRIIPALLVVCLVLIACGFFFLPPSEFVQLGRHISGALGFFSNFLFYKEVSYFDVSSHDKWLLHTWSLSVEWQFYLLLPLGLMLLWKLKPKKKYIVWGFFVSFVISLFLSSLISIKNPSGAFYLLPTRMWEMLAGGLVYFSSHQKNASQKSGRIIEIFGFGLIVFSVGYFSVESIWPSWRALLPVLGAVCVLSSMQFDSLLTASRVAQWLGSRSYSLYLWHWPIVVLLGYLNRQHDLIYIGCALLFTGLLGHLSFTFVEGPAGSYLRKISSYRKFFALIIPVGLSISLAVFVTVNEGLPNRMSDTYENLTKDITMPLVSNGWCFYSVDTIKALPIGDAGLKCSIGDRASKIKGLLFGDSFAGQNEPFWNKIGINESRRIDSITTNWCYPSLGDDFTGPIASRAYAQCKINRNYLFKNVEKYDFVVLAGSWSDVVLQNKIKNFEAALSEVSSRTKMVFIMPSPVSYDANIGLAYERSLIRGVKFDLLHYTRNSDVQTKNANEIIKSLSKKYKNVFYIDRDYIFPEAGVFPGSAGGEVPFSFDGKHISTLGAESAAVFFEKSEYYKLFKNNIHGNENPSLVN